MNKIAVVGAGYVGLVTGVCFAQKENFVIVIERDQKKIKALINGEVPFYEPGLKQLLSEAINNKKIIFVNQINEALEKNPKVIFSCVGTPSLPDGNADLTAVWNVAREVGKNINSYCLFINKSTVPVGTARRVNAIIKEELKHRNLDIIFDVASNPEFLKEGNALNDFLIPDRVVVGVVSKKSEEILYSLYEPFLQNKNQFLSMNWESAELTKYASNSMLATRISFMNQLALLAEKVGADISKVKDGMSKDKRIGSSFLNAGIGYGGSCFPKDVKALIKMGQANKQPMSMIEVVDQVNDQQKKCFINKILNYYGFDLKNKVVGIWGLSFKPETDDIRCAPSVDVIKSLLDYGAIITAYDSQASNNIKNIFGNKINFAKNPIDVLNCSDFLIILTEWKEFLQFNPVDFLKLKDKVVFDGRNCFDPLEMQNADINYFCVGRNFLNIQQSKLAFLSKLKGCELSA